MTSSYRTIWLSGILLGGSEGRLESLLDFLSCTQAQRLYIVGGIAGFWRLKKRGCCACRENKVVHSVLRKAAKGTEVIYLSGGRHRLPRDYVGKELDGIRIEERVIHTTAHGRRFLVMPAPAGHRGAWIHREDLLMEGRIIPVSLVPNDGFEYFQRRLDSLYSFLSVRFGHSKKKSSRNLDQDEISEVGAGGCRGVEGIICPQPVPQAILEAHAGILYCPSGNWGEDCTSLVEDSHGNLTVLDWDNVEPASCPLRLVEDQEGNLIVLHQVDESVWLINEAPGA